MVEISADSLRLLQMESRLQEAQHLIESVQIKQVRGIPLCGCPVSFFYFFERKVLIYEQFYAIMIMAIFFVEGAIFFEVSAYSAA